MKTLQKKKIELNKKFQINLKSELITSEKHMGMSQQLKTSRSD
jgi:hypothetical protein